MHKPIGPEQTRCLWPFNLLQQELWHSRCSLLLSLSHTHTHTQKNCTSLLLQHCTHEMGRAAWSRGYENPHKHPRDHRRLAAQLQWGRFWWSAGRGDISSSHAVYLLIGLISGGGCVRLPCVMWRTWLPLLPLHGNLHSAEVFGLDQDLSRDFKAEQSVQEFIG